MAGKTAAAAKKPAKKRVNTGDSLVCEVCGMSVIVEEIGGIPVAEETLLLCCGKPMKAKASKAKSTKKK
ncbi:MAG TPA: hypothetical protein VJ280_03605 [Dehalococcoidales bacterium]|jgi:hypothetical protein|nr:hypothetical protein [Dehalococcoidales bacterium]